MRSNDLDKQEIIKCFHCGNETPMPKVGEYSWGSRDLEYSDIDFLNKYELFACPVCHKVTLRHSYGDETMIHYHNYDEISYYDEKSILYPQNSIDSNSVPPKVKEAYEASFAEVPSTTIPVISLSSFVTAMFLYFTTFGSMFAIALAYRLLLSSL